MDNMREEFESWHIEQCKSDGMCQQDISSELDRKGDGYVYVGAHYAWRGWKASRAALCVELPHSWIAGELGDDANVFDAVDVMTSLDESGVRYK